MRGYERPKNAWHTKGRLPLGGRAILITRTTEGNSIERQKLEKLGARVIELPSIEIVTPSSFEKLDLCLEHLSDYDWIVFTSTNGVKAFFRRTRKLKIERDVKSLLKNGRKPKLACVGPSTRNALSEEAETDSIFMPRSFLTEELAKELTKKFDLKGKKLLLARAEVASKEMTETLREAGAIVDETAVYRTVPRSKKTKVTLLDGVTDITLTSPSTVDGLIGACEVEEIKLRKIKAHCIGPVTAKHAIERGLSVSSVAKVHTLEGMISSMVDYYRKPAI